MAIGLTSTAAFAEAYTLKIKFNRTQTNWVSHPGTLSEVTYFAGEAAKYDDSQSPASLSHIVKRMENEDSCSIDYADIPIVQDIELTSDADPKVGYFRDEPYGLAIYDQVHKTAYLGKLRHHLLGGVGEDSGAYYYRIICETNSPITQELLQKIFGDEAEVTLVKK